MRYKILSIIILSLICALVLFPVVSARKGVGIVWDTETEIVKENSEHCVQYGIYNPWEEDVTAVLSVSDELKNVITKEDSEEKLIPKGTGHDVAVPIEFCFKVAQLYKEDCLLGNLICEKTCGEEQANYEGKIVAMEKSEGGAGGLAGSSTALGVSVPLKLKVRCDAHPRDWSLVYIAIIVVVTLLILLILIKKQKNK